MILITGFEPFGGDAANPSWPAAVGAVELLQASGTAAVAVELPCAFGTSGPALQQAIEQYQPSVVIAVGLAGGRSNVSIERVAINVDDARIPDNAGDSPVDTPVVSEGPAAYFSTLPVKAAFAALRDAGVPAEVSNTAGTFVCNHIFYELMHQLRSESGRVKGGFVHVPYTPELVPTGSNAPSLSIDTMAVAVQIIAQTALTVETDLSMAAGTLH